MTHAVVLATAAAISSYSAMDRSFFPTFHAGAVTAIAAQGVAVGDLSLRGHRVIIEPLSLPPSALLRRPPILHIIRRDGTLESLRQHFHLFLTHGLWAHRSPLTALHVG